MRAARTEGRHIADPACGTGGFFLKRHTTSWTNPDNFRLDKEQKAFLKYEAIYHRSNEDREPTSRRLLPPDELMVPAVNIGEIEGGASDFAWNDSLVADAGDRFDYVLANTAVRQEEFDELHQRGR